MSSSNCCFLTCIQISQEAGQMVQYSHLFQNFPQFIVIHTVKGFGIVNKAELDVFLELPFLESSGFPYFIQFKSEFGNKEFRIWATVSSWSCFCWLYRASPPLTTKNIINLILKLTIWWRPWLESSLVLLEEGICYDEHVLLAKLLALALLHFVLKSQICLLLQVSLGFLVLHSNPLSWKGYLFWILVLEGLVGLHRTIQFQLLQHYWLGHRLGLLWYWVVCLGNEQLSFCHFWYCTQVLHFGLLLTMMATLFFLRDSCPQ